MSIDISSSSTWSRCRMCMRRINDCDESEAQYIDKILTERILTFTAIQINPHDGLPRKICLDCNAILDLFHRFRKKSLIIQRIMSRAAKVEPLLPSNNSAVLEKDNPAEPIDTEPQSVCHNGACSPIVAYTKHKHPLEFDSNIHLILNDAENIGVTRSPMATLELNVNHAQIHKDSSNEIVLDEDVANSLITELLTTILPDSSAENIESENGFETVTSSGAPEIVTFEENLNDTVYNNLIREMQEIHNSKIDLELSTSKKTDSPIQSVDSDSEANVTSKVLITPVKAQSKIECLRPIIVRRSKRVANRSKMFINQRVVSGNEENLAQSPITRKFSIKVTRLTKELLETYRIQM